MLYDYNAIVYIAGRPQSKAFDAISNIEGASPKSSGRLEFLYIDLMDSSTSKPGVETFLAQQ